MQTMFRIVRATAFACVLGLGTASAATIGQVDTFQNGTTQDWVINLLGMGNPPSVPVNVATGGPAGAGDAYLKLTSTGSPGAGGKLVGINVTQWTGNYIASGINAISMDVNNLGSTNLTLRLLIADPMFGPPADEAFSTAGISLPANSGWTRILFPVDVGAFTPEAGSVLTALTNVTEFRIYHSVTGADQPIAAVLGVDNITALSLPEPASFGLAGAALAGLALLRKRRG